MAGEHGKHVINTYIVGLLSLPHSELARSRSVLDSFCLRDFRARYLPFEALMMFLLFVGKWRWRAGSNRMLSHFAATPNHDGLVMAVGID